jgi:hypothetical protein
VLNDARDGSAWMYSFSGVEPMVFTFYGAKAGSAAETLQNRLNDIDASSSVRRLLEEENVRYVLVGEGFVRPGMERIPGMDRLSDVEGLREVFRNDDAAIYEVVAAVPTG